jgi:hypothetical protein
MFSVVGRRREGKTGEQEETEAKRQNKKPGIKK